MRTMAHETSRAKPLMHHARCCRLLHACDRAEAKRRLCCARVEIVVPTVSSQVRCVPLLYVPAQFTLDAQRHTRG